MDPDRWVQQGCIVYHEKDIDGAILMENLLPGKLHRQLDSPTEGVFTCPIGEVPVEAV